jgi:ABC-type multidrug transport system fused ATPase/permease subunit
VVVVVEVVVDGGAVLVIALVPALVRALVRVLALVQARILVIVLVFVLLLVIVLALVRVLVLVLALAWLLLLVLVLVLLLILVLLSSIGIIGTRTSSSTSYTIKCSVYITIRSNYSAYDYLSANAVIQVPCRNQHGTALPNVVSC